MLPISKVTQWNSFIINHGFNADLHPELISSVCSPCNGLQITDNIMLALTFVQLAPSGLLLMQMKYSHLFVSIMIAV